MDDKGRLVFPAAFKSLMPPGEQMRFVIRKDIFEKCLEMYTYDEWERQSEEVKSRLDFFRKEHAMFWRKYMSDRALVQPDAKMGRFIVPKELLEAIGVNKDVVFSGNDHKIEIWAKEAFADSQISDEEYIALAGTLSDL